MSDNEILKNLDDLIARMDDLSDEELGRLLQGLVEIDRQHQMQASQLDDKIYKTLSIIVITLILLITTYILLGA